MFSRPCVVFASLLLSLGGLAGADAQTQRAGDFAHVERNYQERLLLQKVELGKAQEEVLSLKAKLAQVEGELVQQKLAYREQQQRLSALGLTAVQGQNAVSERLVQAVATAVDLTQQAEARKGKLLSAQEHLLLLLNNQELATSTREHATEAMEELQLALQDSEPQQAVDGQVGVRYEIADYDSELRLAILKSGSREGLRPGLRLQTQVVPDQAPQQLLVVEVRDELSGAIQLDENAPQLVSGNFLQPVLEKIAN